MPKYDFKCLNCEHEFEALTTPQKIEEVKCLQCDSIKTQKLLSAPAIILKGGGFYKTDSSQKTSQSNCSTGSCSGCSSNCS